MSQRIEEQYGLESVDPELEAMLADGGAAVTGGEVWCLFDIDTEDGPANPYAALSRALEDAGYSGASRKGRMNTAAARLDPEGIEIALSQPYVTSAMMEER